MIAGIAAAIAVPSLLILYFLKLRRRDVHISTTLLWKKAIEDLQANAPFQKLRRNILLLLQLLVLAAVLAAVGQPQITGQAPVGDKHVILIDRSASMKSLDGDPDKPGSITRLDRAKAQAIELIDSLREPGLFDRGGGDEAMVIAFDTTAGVLHQFSTDKASLKSAIEAIEATDAPSSLGEAFRLAKAHVAPPEIVEGIGLRAAPGSTIHIWSDGRLPDANKAEPSSADVVLYHAVGSPDAGNVGITALRAERGYENPQSLSVFVGLHSTNRDERSVDVELSIDGAVAAIRSATVGGATQEALDTQEGEPPRSRPVPGSGGVVFNIDRAQGGLVTVALSGLETPSNLLSVDDTAWVVVPPAKRLSIAVVSTTLTHEAIMLALDPEAMPISRLDDLTPEQFEQARDAGQAGQYDVVVLDGWLPTMPEGAKVTLPPGRYVILGAAPAPPFGLIDHGTGDPVMVIDWDREHPALRSTSLGNVIFYEPRRLEIGPDSAATVIAASDDGPAIVELAGAEVRALVVPHDVAKSNWPFDVSFPVFLAAAVRYVGDEGTSALGRIIQPGGTLTERLPAGAGDVRLKLPGGRRVELSPAGDGTIVFGPIRRVGLYALSWTGAAGALDRVIGSRVARDVAANLLSEDESNIATASSLSLAPRVVEAQEDATGSGVRKLWPWLLLACLVLMLLEWFVYNRKVQL